MSLLDLIRKNREIASNDPHASDSVRKILQALDRMDPERARFLAAFAYLLGRVARADLRVSDEETRMMERLVMDRGKLPEDQAMIVVHMAKRQNLLFGGTENFIVTREFKEISTREHKLHLLECLFAVSAADESISTIEANEIRQIAEELKIDPEEYVQLRSAYRDYLKVFKNTL